MGFVVDFVWSEDLSVGIEQIDKQHKVWLIKAEKLFDSGRKGQAREYIDQMLEFLDDYTKQHFRDEEIYMRSIHYPEYEHQKNLHMAFIEKLSRIKKEFYESDGNIIVILDANQMIIEWLVKHISTEDKKIGLYAKNLKEMK